MIGLAHERWLMLPVAFFMQPMNDFGIKATSHHQQEQTAPARRAAFEMHTDIQLSDLGQTAIVSTTSF